MTVSGFKSTTLFKGRELWSLFEGEAQCHNNSTVFNRQMLIEGPLIQNEVSTLTSPVIQLTVPLVKAGIHP